MIYPKYNTRILRLFTIDFVRNYEIYISDEIDISKDKNHD
jgi:hypothetical protein